MSENNSSETPTTPTPEKSSTDDPKIKINKAKDTLGINRMNEDIAALREDVQKTSKGLMDLIEAINSARNPQPQPQPTPTNQPISPDTPISREEMMLIVKDLGGIAADIFKTYKGTGQNPNQDGAYGNIIMQSLARAFQVHVDDIVYGTLQRLPPSAQTQYIPQRPQVQPTSNPVRAGFQK